MAGLALGGGLRFGLVSGLALPPWSGWAALPVVVLCDTPTVALFSNVFASFLNPRLRFCGARAIVGTTEARGGRQGPGL